MRVLEYGNDLKCPSDTECTVNTFDVTAHEKVSFIVYTVCPNIFRSCLRNELRILLTIPLYH